MALIDICEMATSAGEVSVLAIPHYHAATTTHKGHLWATNSPRRVSAHCTERMALENGLSKLINFWLFVVSARSTVQKKQQENVSHNFLSRMVRLKEKMAGRKRREESRFFSLD